MQINLEERDEMGRQAKTKQMNTWDLNVLLNCLLKVWKKKQSSAAVNSNIILDE